MGIAMVSKALPTGMVSKSSVLSFFTDFASFSHIGPFSYHRRNQTNSVLMGAIINKLDWHVNMAQFDFTDDTDTITGMEAVCGYASELENTAKTEYNFARRSEKGAVKCLLRLSVKTVWGNQRWPIS